MKLRGRKLDGAFLSPVDAVRHPGQVRPIGSTALVSTIANGTARLLFKGGLRTIESVAVDPGRTSEIVLAHLVLVEKYGSSPRIVPRSAATMDIPGSVDALLLAGDEAAHLDRSEPWIDLVDEWRDVTGLPFVHGLWYAAGEALGEGEMPLFAPPEVTGDQPDGPTHADVTYQLGENERSGAIEFMSMAYYHGILKDMPETSSFLPGTTPPRTIQ